MCRIIFHIDMDAFYAAVEIQQRPELKGKPVIIGADPKGGKGRGVVSTASYEARHFGVHSALPISRAYRLCPQGIYLPPNMRLYVQVSHQIMDIFRQYTDRIEPISIDEAFLDMSNVILPAEEPKHFAVLIKNQIKKETGLTASIGIAPNKFLAKVASDLNKPDGLTEVIRKQEKEFLAPLPIRKLWGVGIKTEIELKKLAISTIGDIQKMTRERLKKELGKHGEFLWELAQGIDDRPVEMERMAKSVSQERTFETDVEDKSYLLRTLHQCAHRVAESLREDHLAGKTIQLKLRWKDFTTFTRQKTLSGSTDDSNTIYEIAKKLMEESGLLSQKIRLIGVGVSGLSSSADSDAGDSKTILQESLFD